jgi:hypothetical protein
MDRQPTVIALGRRKTERLTADCTSHESNLPKGIHKLTSVDAELIVSAQKFIVVTATLKYAARVHNPPHNSCEM